MATEIGGVQLGIVIGDGSSADPDQFNAISQFFQGYYSTQATVNPGKPGEQVMVTDLGKTLYNYDAGASDTIKFKGNFSGAVGTNKDTTIKGGDGDNSIIITDNVHKTVKLGAGDDFLQSSGSAAITADGGAGNDSIVGGSSSDNIKGGSGNDYLQGRGGNDIISGGGGKDVIVGGTGNDTMTGGAGNDIFVITNEAHEGKEIDVITDFKKGDILQIADRNGDNQITVGDGGDVTSIIHNTELNTITVTLNNGDTVVLDNIKNDKLNLKEGDDGSFTLG